MPALPIQSLHLETLVFPLFLLVVLLTQLARSAEPGYFMPGGHKYMYWLLLWFALLLIGFGAALSTTSPLLGAELAAGFTLSLLHPVNALCFLVHLLFLRPWEIVTTNAVLKALPRGTAAFCFFPWLLHRRLHGRPNAHAQYVLKLVLVFSAWLFLTTFVAPNIGQTQRDWFGTYFISLVVFVMCLFFIDSERSLEEFKLTLVISTLALMVVRMHLYQTQGSEVARLESSAVFGDPNDLAAVIVMALPFALVPIFDDAAHLGQQILGILFGGASLLVIWYTESRGAILALVAQLLTAGHLRTGSKWLNTIVLASFLGGGYFVAINAIPRESADMDISSKSRITYWKTAANMTFRHPVFGVGFGQYPANYEAYSVGTRYEWGLRTAHSSWFLAFAESGLLGGILFLSFFVSILRTAWRNRQRRPDELYALVGYGVVMSFLSHTYATDLYLLAGLILASDSLANPVTEHGR
jgi:O-antigen ligase